MPIVDTAWRCGRCDGEFPSVAEAVLCEKRDEWTKKLEDRGARMYTFLTRATEEGRLSMSLSADLADFFEELGPPPPARTT